MNIFNKPNSGTAEITLIGTGGYGESVVIHLGNDDWVVIDSCKNRNSGKILPLEYLEKLKVNLAHVKLIICTHWHDDHIKGISEMFGVCENAVFCFAKCSSLRQFFVFLGLGELKGEKLSQTYTEEFNKCIDLINENGRKVVYSSIDRMVLKTDSNNCIPTLSPADATHEKFEKKLGELIKIGRDPNRELLARSPNHLSIATLLSIGQHHALLGADMEITTDNNEGWANIVENCNAIKSIKSSFFKIPHHGSSTGYYKLVWDKLLSSKPISTLTPWNLGRKLPQDGMLSTYLSHTDKLFITSNNNGIKPKKRSKAAEKLIKEICKEDEIKIEHIQFDAGYIRSRILLDDPNSVWEVTLLDAAKKVGKNEKGIILFD